MITTFIFFATVWVLSGIFLAFFTTYIENHLLFKNFKMIHYFFIIFFGGLMGWLMLYPLLMDIWIKIKNKKK